MAKPMTNVHLNDAVLNELAKVLEEDFPSILASFIHSSAKILASIPESLIKEDPEEFIMKIHSIKGSCRNIGAEHLAELCKHTEALAKSSQINEIDPTLTEIKSEFDTVKNALLAYQTQ